MFVGWRDEQLQRRCSSASTVPLGVVLGALIIFGVGQLDDLREVSPPAKIAGTVLAGSVLSIAGVSILFFRIPFAGLVSLSPDMSALLTVVWVIGMSTAINYIDGLDGLAAGIVAIAAAALLLYCERLDGAGAIGPENAGPLIAAATLGACLGFLPAQLPPRHDLHGRRRRAAPRPADGRRHHHRRRQHRHPVLGPDLLLLRPAVHPARHPRRADHRHGLLDRAASPAGRRRHGGGQGPPAPPPDAARATASAAACSSSGRGRSCCRPSRSTPPTRTAGATSTSRWPSPPRRWCSTRCSARASAPAEMRSPERSG